MDYKRYDEVLNSILLNVMVEEGRDNGIYLKGYDGSAKDKLYLNAAIATSALTGQQKIVMLMPLHKYIVFLCKNWKGKRQFKWMSDWRAKSEITSNLNDILDCVAKALNVTDEEFEEIYNAYYGG